MGCCCGRKTRYTITLIVGLVFIALPFAFHDLIQREIRSEVASNLKIQPGSQIYDQWKKPTLPVYLQIHTFDIANPLEVKQGKPPAVIEKGPYSYREHRVKVNISWGHNNVTFNQISRYVFDAATSCDTCDPSNDTITTFNIPLVAITQLLGRLRVWKPLRELIDIFLDAIGDKLFITKTVNQTIWGYEDPLFEDYNKFRKDLIDIPIIGYLAKNLPKLPSVFALQPDPNFDGVTTVDTGQSNIDKLGHYLEWKGMKKLPYWTSRVANMLNGTDGSIYKPHVTTDDNLYIFIIQLCRSLHVNYLAKSTIRGIDALKFHPPPSTFLSGNINPDNKGFCNPNCLPSGLLSVNACVPFNAPIVVSSPHFLNGDPILLKKVLGLHPDEEKHDTFVHVEPTTGVVLQASKRLQFNIHVEPVSGIPLTSGLTPTHVPIMWVNEHVKIDKENADKLKKDVLVKLEIVKWVQIGLIILGGLLVLIALVLFLRLCCCKKEDISLQLIAESTANNPNTNYETMGNGNAGLLNPSLINASGGSNN